MLAGVCAGPDEAYRGKTKQNESATNKPALAAEPPANSKQTMILKSSRPENAKRVATTGQRGAI